MTHVVMEAQSLSSVAAGSGTGTYVRHLLAELAHDPTLSMTALCAPGATLPDGIGRLTVRRLAQRPRLELMENSVRLPVERVLSRPHGAVFHNPGFHAPPALRSPWVQTLHDLIPLRFNAPDIAALRARWKRFAPRYRKADAVIAISQHSADEGIALLGLDPAKVHVAHHGIDPRYCVGGGTDADEAPYLLVVSEYSRRKGFAEAFAVLDALADAGYPHRLVVAGQVHAAVRDELEALHAAAKYPERIEISGFVPDLIALYQGATAYLMTSRYEGFGFPALEAMACGVPVVAFDNTAMPEVVGDAGALVADGDAVAMTEAVRQVLDSTALAAERRAQGIERAAHFTWARSAAIHAEVYRSVAAAS